MKRENLKSSHRKKTYYIQRIKDIADISLGVMRKEDNEIQSTEWEKGQSGILYCWTYLSKIKLKYVLDKWKQIEFILRSAVQEIFRVER